MPKVRCKWYTPDGEPMGPGCKRIGVCDFVHPSDPLWFSAPPSKLATKTRDDSGSWGGGGGKQSGEGAWGGGGGNNAGTDTTETGWGGVGNTSAEGSGGGDGGWESTAGGGGDGGWGSTASGGGDGGWGSTASGGGWGDVSPAAGAGSTVGGWGDGGGRKSARPIPTGPRGAGKRKKSDSNTGETSGWNQLAASTRGKPVDSGWASKSKMASKPHDTPSGWGDSAATPWGDTGGPSAWQPEANSAPAMTFGGGDASGGWGGVSSAPGWPSDVHATSTGWDASPSATQWGAAGAAEGSGGGQWSSGGGNMTAGGWNISETSSKDQKQNRPYGPNEPANPRLSAAAGNDFTSSSMPQDDSGSYPMRSPASTLRRLNERDHEPCNETKGKRSDSESRNDSRAASPCESSSSGRLPEYREYIRALLRTLDLFTESQKAEEDLNWSAHMQRHEHHARRGEWGQDVLNITKKDMQQKSRSAKKRYEAALNVLSTLPIINPATMASANPNEDLTQMQAYMKELENWMEQVRPVIAQTCNAIANQPQDEPAVESRVATKDDPSLIPIQKLWATAKKLEKKLSSLEVYHEEMRGNRFDMVHSSIERAQFPPRSTVNTPGPRLSASESETLRVRCQETEREIEDMNDALLLIRKDVDKLVRRTSEREIEIQSVRAENESLKAKIAQTQQFDAVLTQQFQEASTEMTALKKLVDDLVNTKPRTPHPVVSPEVVLSLLETQLKAKVRTEMEVVLGTIKQGVHEALEAQQRDLCSVVWVQLQPTLRLATVIQETVNDPQFKNLLVSPGSSHE